MEFRDIFRVIREIEFSYPINEWEINKIKIWPIIKNRIVRSLLIDKEIEGVTKPNSILHYVRNFFPSLFSYLRTITFDYKKNARIKKVDIVIRSCASDRTFLGEKYYDKICDPLIDELINNNISHLALEIPNKDGQYKYPRHNSSFLIFISAFIARIKILIKLKCYTKKNHVQSHKYDELRISLKEKYYVDIKSFSSYFRDISLIYEYYVIYRNILTKAMPKLGVVMNYYSADGMGFVLACKKFKIPSADIQHGLQGEFHSAYGEFSNIPKQGYDLLPSYFLVWSKKEETAINKWANKTNFSHRAIIIGNLWLNMWRKNDNSQIQKINNIFINKFPIIEKKINIVITLQLYLIPDLLLSVIRKSDCNIMWWIRLHPVFGRDYKGVKNQLKNIENYNIIEATSFPINTLLLNADIHITEFSTSVVEAAYFNIPSIIISQKGIDNYSSYIERGIAKPAISAKEITKFIKILSKEKNEYKKEKVEKNSFISFIKDTINIQ